MVPEWFSSVRKSLIEPAHDVMRHRPLLRSVVYGVGINAIGFAASHLLNPTGDREWSMPYVLAVHTLAMPCMGAFTYAFIRVSEADKAWWHQAIIRQSTRYLIRGLALGSVVYLAQTGIAVTLGWASFVNVHSQHVQKIDVVWTLASHLANIYVAWNEEMLYRGYGLHSLQQAIGPVGAVTVLVPLFAWGHGSGWQTFIGQSALGFSTTGLMVASKSLWFPIGYHAAWNYMQTAILGPPDASPSLIPMQVDGPKLWMGRPGYPEPGLLSTLVNLAVAAVAFVFWWRSRSASLP